MTENIKPQKKADNKFIERRTPDGHEIPLASLIRHKGKVEITLMNNVTISGVVSAFDKWTVTILPEGAEFPTTYFKHGILSFSRVA